MMKAHCLSDALEIHKRLFVVNNDVILAFPYHSVSFRFQKSFLFLNSAWILGIQNSTSLQSTPVRRNIPLSLLPLFFSGVRSYPHEDSVVIGQLIVASCFFARASRIPLIVTSLPLGTFLISSSTSRGAGITTVPSPHPSPHHNRTFSPQKPSQTCI